MIEIDASTPLRKWIFHFPKIIYVVILIIAIFHAVAISIRDPLFNNSYLSVLEQIFATYNQTPIKAIKTSGGLGCDSDFTLLKYGKW